MEKAGALPSGFTGLYTGIYMGFREIKQEDKRSDYGKDFLYYGKKVHQGRIQFITACVQMKHWSFQN